MAWSPFSSKRSQLLSVLDGNNRTEARRYREAFGLAASRAINRMVVNHHLAASVAAGASKSTALGQADALLQVENRNGLTARAQIAALAHGVTGGTLHNRLAGAAILPEASYGAAVADADRLKAAKWIVHTSNSLNHAAHDAPVDATLQTIIANGLGRTFHDLRAINHAFNFAAGPPPPRYISAMGGKLPAPPTGAALLEQNVTPVLDTFAPANAQQWTALGLYYLGAIIRSHGFADQNGRTGRALYALCFLWGGVPFQAPTRALEDALHDL